MSFATASPKTDTAPPPAARRVLQRKCRCGGNAPAGGECEECRKKKLLQRKPLGGFSRGADASVDAVLSAPGEPLDAGTRSFLENGFAGARPRVAPSGAMQGKLAISPVTDPAEAEADRFSERALSGGSPQAAAGTAPDLSSIRIHTDAAAGRAAAGVGARAYTVGNHIVFGGGQYDHRSREGRRLLAHEAAHVLQQSAAAPVIQRNALPPDPCQEKKTAVTAHKVYKEIQAAGGKPARQSREIVDMAVKGAACTDDLDKFTLLLDTPDLTVDQKDPAVKAEREEAIKKSRTAGATAAYREKTRLRTDEGMAREDEEKTASAGKGYATATGKGATYGINADDFTNIFVKAKVRLKAANNKGAEPILAASDIDVSNITTLKDGVEKAASTLGYTLILDFVNTAGPDVFQSNVDLGEWTNSGNWVGKDPEKDLTRSLAHELHHRLGLRDRYDYKDHAKNPKMARADRIHWFHFTMLEGGWVDPLRAESLMGQGMVLVSDDICRVALNLRGEHQFDDDKALAKDPVKQAKFDACMSARKDLPEKAAKPAQVAAMTVAMQAKLKFNTGVKPPSPVEESSDSLRPKGSPTSAEMRETALVHKAATLLGTTFTASDLLATLERIQTLSGAKIFIASNRDAACIGDDGKNSGGSAPIFLCPTFYSFPPAHQADVILRHAAAIATGTSPARTGACSAYDCSTLCSSEADRWVHFIRCAAKP